VRSCACGGDRRAPGPRVEHSACMRATRLRGKAFARQQRQTRRSSLRLTHAPDLGS
jgi:hypothetical protein